MDWERTQLEVLERDGYRCNRCGSSEDVSVYLLSSMRGRYDLAGTADCMTVCPSCDPAAERTAARDSAPGTELPDFGSLPARRRAGRAPSEPVVLDPETELVVSLR